MLLFVWFLKAKVKTPGWRGVRLDRTERLVDKRVIIVGRVSTDVRPGWRFVDDRAILGVPARAQLDERLILVIERRVAQSLLLAVDSDAGLDPLPCIQRAR